MGAPVLTGQVCLGGATFSLLPGFPEEEAVAVIRAAANSGIRVFDSARAYAPVGNPTHNEALFARALADRDDSLIGTKGGHFRTGPRTWDVDNSPERLRRDVDDSLRALRMEQLGLYYLHRADGPTASAAVRATLHRSRTAWLRWPTCGGRGSSPRSAPPT